MTWWRWQNRLRSGVCRHSPADELALLLHRAIKVATDPPTGPVFISLPIDVLEQSTENGAWPKGELFRKSEPNPDAIERRQL